VIIKKTVRKQNKRASTSRQRKTQHLLDVKVRAKNVAARRTQKVFLTVCAVFLIISVVGGIAFGAKYAMNALFFKNTDYALKTIEVTTDGSLSRDTILKTAKIALGENIFSIELPKVQEKLTALPQVEESRVERILPNKINISIQERRPVAWVVPPDTATGSFNFEDAYLVDRRGILLRTKSLAAEYLGLPLIVGVDTSNCQEGQPLELDEVKSALDLIRAASEILQARFQIQSIDVSKKYCLIATDKQRASITFSPENMEWQLRRLDTVLNYCDQNSRELQTVNLMAQRNVPVTFVPNAQPAVPLETPADGGTSAKLDANGNPIPNGGTLPNSNSSAKIKDGSKTGSKSSPSLRRKVRKGSVKRRSTSFSRNSLHQQEMKTQPRPEENRLKTFPGQTPTVRRAIPVEPTQMNG
jgi:cell division protein FtsQ